MFHDVFSGQNYERRKRNSVLYFCDGAQLTRMMYSLKGIPKCPMIWSCPIYSLLCKSRLNASVLFYSVFRFTPLYPTVLKTILWRSLKRLSQPVLHLQSSNQAQRLAFQPSFEEWAPILAHFAIERTAAMIRGLLQLQSKLRSEILFLEGAKVVNRHFCLKWKRILLRSWSH